LPSNRGNRNSELENTVDAGYVEDPEDITGNFNYAESVSEKWHCRGNSPA
jgi:hypothetical protein